MNKQVPSTSIHHTQSTTQLAEQMSAEVKYCKNIFHLAIVLLKDMNSMAAIEHGLSNLISSL